MRKLIRLVRNIAFDVKYGGFLGGVCKTRFPECGAVDTANSDYSALRHLFGGRIKEGDVLVDVGCGKGRVINWWLENTSRNEIIGLELDPLIADKTRHRLKQRTRVSILAGNAIDNLPEKGSLFYLFNPFDLATTTAFKDRFKEMFEGDGSKRIVYYNCIHRQTFDGDPAFDVSDLVVEQYGPFHKAVLVTFRSAH